MFIAAIGQPAPDLGASPPPTPLSHTEERLNQTKPPLTGRIPPLPTLPPAPLHAAYSTHPRPAAHPAPPPTAPVHPTPTSSLWGQPPF